MHLHTNPGAGWLIAEKFAAKRLLFPMPLIGRNVIVSRAYLHILNPGTGSDRVVDEARRLFIGPQSGVVKALLMAGLGTKPEEHLKVVASKTGIPLEVVSAFEILFFNILDRSEDGLYLSSIAYPHGRPVTFNKTYFKDASLDDLLLRAAYDKRDVDFVEYLSGLEPSHFQKALKESKRMERELTEKIFSNAQVQVNAGLVNQKSVGINRAAKLLEPARRKKQVAPCLEVSVDFDLGEQLNAFLDQAKNWDQWPAPKVATPQPPVVVEIPKSSGSRTKAGKKGDRIDYFPVPRKGIWRNKDADKPVVVVAVMSSPGMPDHYLTEEKSGIPVSEVEFED